MKKVRYLVGTMGALGIAPVVGGAVTQAASAAPAQRPPAAHTGKVVAVPQSAAFTCPAESKKTAHSGTGINKFSGWTWGTKFTSIACVKSAYGTLHHSQVALLMRIRTYHNNTQKSWGYVNGTINVINSTTNFHKENFNANSVTKACEALVYTSNHAVAYGPVCQNW